MSVAGIASIDPELAEELRSRYEIDGFASVGRILSGHELSRLSEHLDAVCDGDVALPEGVVKFHADTAWGPGTGVTRRDAVWIVQSPHEHDPVFAALAAHPRILELAGLFLGGRPAIVSSQVVAKPARHGAIVPWHQDSYYWPNELRITCWLAIDDATPENGCMRMIPGSHRHGRRERSSRRFERIDRELFETEDVRAETQVYVPVPAGCASFHSQMVVHASDANASARRRRAIALNYSLAARG